MTATIHELRPELDSPLEDHNRERARFVAELAEHGVDSRNWQRVRDPSDPVHAAFRRYTRAVAALLEQHRADAYDAAQGELEP